MIYVPIILYTARLNLSNFLAKLQSREFQGFEKVESIVGVGWGGVGARLQTQASKMSEIDRCHWCQRSTQMIAIGLKDLVKR